MKIVLPNIWMLLLRIVLLALFAYMYQWPIEKIRTGQYHSNELIFWVGLFAFSMFPAYIIWTLFGVLWVTISNDKSTIRFHHIYKTLEVTGAEIDNYYKTVLNSKLNTFQGLLIKLKSNSVVEVTEYNLKSINEITSFLCHNKAALRGNKSSWFPFKRKV